MTDPDDMLVTTNNKKDYDKRIREIVGMPQTSFWLRDALQAALNRDPVDAARDAEQLFQLLNARCEAVLANEFAYFSGLMNPYTEEFKEQ